MTIKKVLLFAPPAYTSVNNIDINPLPPLGLAYLASVLEEIGIEVRIYDCLVEGWYNRKEEKPGIIRIGSNFAEIKKIIADFEPDVVGVNNLFSKQKENAHKIYALAKNVNPGIVTIAGGAHPTVMPDAVMRDENVDFAVLGEGENTIRDLVGYFEGRVRLDKIDGIAFRHNSKIEIIPKRTFIDNLDDIPFPAWHLLNFSKYFGLEASHGKRRHRCFSPIITSRGCPAGCTFCTAHHVWGRGYRKRSPENVIAEMRRLRNDYGIKELMFEDDNVTLATKRAEEIFDLMVEEKLGFEWDTPNGVAAFALNEPLIKKMKDSGCYQLNLAVESGNSDVLKNIIKKPLDLKKIKPLVNYARGIGINVGIFLILGMPGETIEQMWDTFKFAKDLKIYQPFISVATPYPGSELYKICRDNEYISHDYSLDNLFISSYSISTRDWNSQDLRKVFEEGWVYLQKAFYREHPILLVKKILQKMFTDPAGLIRKCNMALRR